MSSPNPSPILLISSNRKETSPFTDPAHPAGVAGYQITADPKEANELIQSHRFSAVVADAELPNGIALALLDRARQMQPRAMRFLSVSNSNADQATQCLWNSHRVLDRPLDQNLLTDAVGNAVSVEKWVSDRETQNLIASIRTFPSRPTTYFKILKHLSDAAADADGLVKLIQSDLAVTTKILQTVNSAMFSHAEPVSDLKAAVQTLGFETVKMLVIAIQAVASLDKMKPAYFSLDQIWKFSLQVAETARKIAQHEGIPPAVADQAYLAGLLHDLGKAVFACNFEARYREVLEEVARSGVPLIEAERKAFGVTHSEVGAYLIALWGLPSQVVDAVGYHHTPSASEGHEFDALTCVFAANLITSSAPDAPEDALYIGRLGLGEKLAGWREQFGINPGQAPKNAPSAAAAPRPSAILKFPTPPPASPGRFAKFLTRFRN